jgi:type I restriction enzyme, S subunit
MNTLQFLGEFKHIASAPEGVQRLRQMIYNLAITGDLTRQLADDGDAKSLLRTIETKKARLIDEKRFKRSPKLENQPLLLPTNINLPNSWCWSRLVDIGEISPKNESADDTLASFIPMGGVPQSHSGKLGAEQRLWGEIKKGFTQFADGDVVLAKITPCFENGKAAVIAGLTNGIGAGTTELHVVRPLYEFIVPDYIYIFLRSPYFAAEGQSKMTGTAGQKRLPTEYFATRPFPLPPISEQRRIVAKVDELMEVCDKLEAQQQEREIKCEFTRTRVFQALGRATTRTELHTAWLRVGAHAPLLSDTPESIQSYRAAILDLAMSGWLLAPEQRAPSTGFMLLEEIAQSRAAWAQNTEGQEQKEAIGMQKKVRKQRAVIPSVGLPKHWTWGSLLQISQAVVDCHNKTAPYVSDGIHLVRTTDIRRARMDLTHAKKISPDTYAYWARRLPPKAGDVFFTREAPMGEAAIVPEGEKVCLGQRTILIRLFSKLFNNRFLIYAIYSPSFQERMVKNAIGMTVKHLRVGGVEDLMVPVPPKEEQDRIVAVVDALFAHCDQLETQIATRRDTASDLAKASVEVITGIRIEDQDKMKAPKRELVSNLHIGDSPRHREQAPLTAILIRNQGELSAKALWGSSGLEIDAFYQQLKTEMANGWIVQPHAAYMKEVETA